MKNATPELIARRRCVIGENPLWDDRRQALLWTDIPSGHLYRYEPREGRHERFYMGQPVGGFTLQADGSLLLFQVNQVSRLEEDGRQEVLRRDIDTDMDRFNDVIADPRGRVFAGTIGKDDQRGGLYRVDLDGSIRCLFKGTGCSNGMGFSPDLQSFYWTCSTTRMMFRFDYDLESGELSQRSRFASPDRGGGIPDGMTVDVDGFLWSARWGGSSIVRYDPSGGEVDALRLPTAKVSSVTFGGPGLDQLYVTTAAQGEDADPDAGSLYRIQVPHRGRPPFRSRILES